MNRIDELLAQLAPDGVHYSTLRQVANYRTGEQLNRSTMSEDAPYPVLNGGIGQSGRHSCFNTEGDTIAISQGGASAGYVNFVTERFWAGAHCYIVEPRSAEVIENRFLFFVLKNGEPVLRASKLGAGIPGLSRSGLASFSVPVPPLDVQREIVRVLDAFTELEAELEAALEAELEARKVQYAFHRDDLLETTDPSTRFIRLGDIASIVRGSSPRPIRSFLTTDETGVPWIKIGDVKTNGKYVTSTAERVTLEGASKSRLIHPGDFILSNSMSFGRPYISQIDGCIHDGWLAISDFADSFLPDFLYHLLRSNLVQVEFARRAGAGTVRNLNADIVKSIVLPVPSLYEQERTVAVLDKFDNLVSDLSIGLPAELKARRQQYEYYRDNLLTFKEAAA